MKEKNMKEKKRKYSSVSNLLYIYKDLWKYDKRIIGFAFLEIIFAVITAVGAILLPSIIINMLENNIELNSMIWRVLIIFLVYGIISGFSTYLTRRNTFQYVEYRAGFLHVEMSRKIMSVDYDIYENEETQKLSENSWQALSGNNSGIEGILHKMTLVVTAIIGLIVYSLLLAKVNLLIILLLLVISLIQFICFQGANKYEMKNKDKKAELEITKRYMDRQANEVSAGKDIRIYQLQYWLTSKYKKVNKKYQEIIAKERIRYFANDLVGLFMQLIRDTICYGYLIYLLKNGQMQVSEFVLYIGLVASFAVYFNDITSNVIEIERFQKLTDYFREFLDIKNKVHYGEGRKLNFKENTFEVEFSHVTFSYPKSDEKESKKILDDISFTMKRGEKMALVGINGAGKNYYC